MKMSKFLSVALLGVAIAFASITKAAEVPALPRPVITFVNSTFINNDPTKPAVQLGWKAYPFPPDAFQFQRKLFVWGWRNVGTINGNNVAWADRRPSKREASYRMRALRDGDKSPWSNVVKIKP